MKRTCLLIIAVCFLAASVSGCIGWATKGVRLSDIPEDEFARAEKIVTENDIRIEVENADCRGASGPYTFYYMFSVLTGLPYVSSVSSKEVKFRVHAEYELNAESKVTAVKLISIPLIGGHLSNLPCFDYNPSDDDKFTVFYKIYNPLPLEKKYSFWKNEDAFFQNEVKQALLHDAATTLTALNTIGNSKLFDMAKSELNRNKKTVLSDFSQIHSGFQQNSELKKQYNAEMLTAHEKPETILKNEAGSIKIPVFTPINVEKCNQVTDICEIRLIQDNKAVFLSKTALKALKKWDDDFYSARFKAISTTDAYLSFYRDYPHAPMAEKALYEWAVRKKDLASLDRFMKAYPDGDYHKKAKKLAEPVLYEKIDSEKEFLNEDFVHIDRYIQDYPKGKKISKVRTIKEEKEFKLAKQKNTIESFDDYLGKYPKGRYVSEAKRRRESVMFENAKDKDTIAAYESYLSSYPRGRFSSKAKASVRKINERLERTYAANYDDMLSFYKRDRVKFTFTTSGVKAFKVIDQVKAAMRVRDPVGIFNPFWVPRFEGAGAKGNKGVVVGKWYTYDFQGWNNWRNHMEPLLNEIDGLASYAPESMGTRSSSSGYSSGTSSTGSKSFKCYYSCRSSGFLHETSEKFEMTIKADTLWEAKDIISEIAYKNCKKISTKDGKSYMYHNTHDCEEIY